VVHLLRRISWNNLYYYASRYRNRGRAGISQAGTIELEFRLDRAPYAAAKN
jgi:hypothetical protein